jgi:hypothetical protein
MIHFTCPACHRPIRAPDPMAGQRHKCPGCQHLLTVPEAMPSPHLPASPAEPMVADLPAVRPAAQPVLAEQKPALPAKASALADAPMIGPEPASPSPMAQGREVGSVEAEQVREAATPVPVAASPALPGPAVVVVVAPAPPDSVLPPPHGSRAGYFAPAGYAATDPRAVPFKAPGLRRRLEQISVRPQLAATPSGTSRQPALAIDPSYEMATTDVARETRK